MPIIAPMETSVLKAVKALVAHFENQKAAAAAIGVEQPTISAWLNGGHGVSARSAIRAERATGGAIRAVDLCPDLAISDDSAA